MQHCIAMSVLGIEQRCLHPIFVCIRWLWACTLSHQIQTKKQMT